MKKYTALTSSRRGGGRKTGKAGKKKGEGKDEEKEVSLPCVVSTFCVILARSLTGVMIFFLLYQVNIIADSNSGSTRCTYI